MRWKDIDNDDNSNSRQSKKLYVEIDSKRKLNIHVKLRSFLLSMWKIEKSQWLVFLLTTTIVHYGETLEKFTGGWSSKFSHAVESSF